MIMNLHGCSGDQLPLSRAADIKGDVVPGMSLAGRIGPDPSVQRPLSEMGAKLDGD